MDLTVTHKVTAYTVSALPEGTFEGHHWSLIVEYRGPSQEGGDSDRWTVKHSGFLLVRNNNDEWEWQPDGGWLRDSDEFISRFTHDEALRLADKWAPLVTVNGLTAADLLARQAARRAAGE